MSWKTKFQILRIKSNPKLTRHLRKNVLTVGEVFWLMLLRGIFLTVLLQKIDQNPLQLNLSWNRRKIWGGLCISEAVLGCRVSNRRVVLRFRVSSRRAVLRSTNSKGQPLIKLPRKLQSHLLQRKTPSPNLKNRYPCTKTQSLYQWATQKSIKLQFLNRNWR